MKTIEINQCELIERLIKDLNNIQKDLSLLKDLIPQEEKPQKKKTQWGIIEVGGLRFADTNLGTDKENPYGKYYTWDEAMKACPKGWKIPSKKKLVNFLNNTIHEWVENKEAVNGMKFTDKLTGSSIFLPAMGVYSLISNPLSTFGDYWLSTSEPLVSYNLWFKSNGNACLSSSSSKSNKFPVRCIKIK